MDDGDSEQIYAGERKTIEDEVAVTKERRIRLNGLLKGYLHVGHMKKLMPLQILRYLKGERLSLRHKFIKEMFRLLQVVWSQHTIIM